MAGLKVDPKEIGYSGQATDITAALNTVYAVAGITAVVVIIIAGYFYTTANGNVDQVRRGKNMLLGSVIGLIVIMMAFGVTNFITGRIK